MRTVLYLPRLIAAAFGVGLLACGASDLTLPGNASPTRVLAVSGGGQAGPVNSRLPDPLVVRVQNRAGEPLADVQLVFRFRNEFPDARIEPAEQQTDANGEASVEIRLGSTAGSQTVEATIAQEVAPDARAVFGVTALERRGRGRDGGGGDDKDKDKDKD